MISDVYIVQWIESGCLMLCALLTLDTDTCLKCVSTCLSSSMVVLKFAASWGAFVLTPIWCGRVAGRFYKVQHI